MREPFIPTPEMIAAAWDAWAPRHKPHVRLGSGPAFREAIQAALAKMQEATRPPLHETADEIEGGQP